MSLLSIFASAILPIVAIAAVGFVLGRVRTIAVDPLNTVTIYVLAPALVFHSIATTELGGETLVKIVVGVVGFVVVMAALAEAVGRALGEDEPVRSALVLASTFSNAGNFGIPLSAFAFGAVGRATAVVFLAGQSLVMYTVGVYLAARSGGDGGLGSIKQVFELPLVYAVVFAVLVRWLGVVPPADGTAMETVKLVGDAAIPLMLVLLGIQLANTNYGAAVGRVGTANALKLVVAPVVALGVAIALGFAETTVARVFVLECATPAAITPLILVIEMGSDRSVGGVTAPEYVSAAVLTTTLASVPVLTGVIAGLETDLIGSLL